MSATWFSVRDAGERLVDALRRRAAGPPALPWRSRRCRAARPCDPRSPSMTVGAVRGDDPVDLAAQLVGGLLELGHLVATEGVGVVERGLDRLVAARRQVAEVAAVGRQERDGVVVDRPLRSVEERLDRVDDVLLGFEQVVAEVEVVEIPVVGLADGLLQQADGAASCVDERVLRAADRGLELVELALELVGAVAGQLQRVLRCVALVEEVGAELAEGGDLALVEDLLRGDDRVRVLLRVAQRRGDLAALEDVAVDRQRDLRGADQRSDDRPRSRRGPSRRAWPGRCRRWSSPSPARPGRPCAGSNDSTSSAGCVELQQGVGVEQAAVGVGGAGDLLLAVGRRRRAA